MYGDFFFFIFNSIYIETQPQWTSFYWNYSHLIFRKHHQIYTVNLLASKLNVYNLVINSSQTQWKNILLFNNTLKIKIQQLNCLVNKKKLVVLTYVI